MAMSLYENSHPINDNRRVALIKSLATNNRFYALVTPESGIRNADTVDSIPEGMLLGIAYPCLEDGLNDFAVIRTTYETLDFFPDDDDMRGELMDIVNEARGKLTRRLTELRDRVTDRTAHFLGTDLDEFKAYALDIVHRGYPRRNLDSMMKLNVFGSVAEAEGHANGSEPLFHYEFRNPSDLPCICQNSPRDFVAALFGDVLDSVLDDANYQSRYTFDRNVFQKFIALMFVNYATTDPIFYGTNRADYGVSEDKEMDRTPLYIAVGRELREVERRMVLEEGVERGLLEAITGPAEQRPALLMEERQVQLPGTLVNEDVLLAPISSICARAQQIFKTNRDDRDTAEFALLILADASRLVKALKELGIVSPFAYDPGTADLPEERRSDGSA
jgi:hypothetical protein